MMHESMIEEIAENRGYDRGFTAGTSHAHELVNKQLTELKHKRAVAEEEGWPRYDQGFMFQNQINILEEVKLIIRKGYYDNDTIEAVSR